jgi:lysophospholipase
MVRVTMIHFSVRSIFLFLIFFSFSRAQDPQFQYLKTADGLILRVAQWVNSTPNSHSKTVLFLEGRASFIEKHQETVQDLLSQGHDVWMFDWRGHGGSSRLLKNPQKIHIDRYETYLKDLHQIVHQVVKPKARFPLVFLGVSFGGHMALRYASDHGDDLEGMILVSPMLDVQTSPFSYDLARALTRTALLLGFEEMYAAGYGDYIPLEGRFEKNLNTQDRFRYERQRKLCINNMQLVTGGPTYGWVNATFNSIDYIKQSGFLESIKIPTLILSAGLIKWLIIHEIKHFVVKWSLVSKKHTLGLTTIFQMKKIVLEINF